VTWTYATDLFEEASIARMAAGYAALLGAAAARPETRLQELELLAEDERKRRAMERAGRQEFEARNLRFARRKAVDLEAVELVRSGFLEPGLPLPLVMTPGGSDVDLIDWAGENRTMLEEKLLRHGGILFRGFDVAGVEAFERFAQAICPELFGEYGDLPREQVGGKVYSSTPYPPDKPILFHNESSQMDCWPLKQWFYCVTPAEEGGETPIADCRRVYELLRPEIRERFAREGVMYVRNFTEALDVPWQEFFHTSDPAEVAAVCRRAGIELEWRGDWLRTRKRAPAVIAHPKTGETLFFNQIQAHHVSCLDGETRSSLLSLFGEEGLPRNVYYGGGAPIEDEVMAEIVDVYWRVAVQFPWQRHDVLMLDNMLTAHSRNPFKGARKIAVVMGDMIQNPQL
jgi:alpha-ketoglutarate-dependent taurine dioxygenase